MEFNAQQWDRMVPAERVNCCLALAQEAQKLADQANEKFKPLYLDMRDQWLTLASEIANAANAPSRRSGVGGSLR